MEQVSGNFTYSLEPKDELVLEEIDKLTQPSVTTDLVLKRRNRSLLPYTSVC